MAGEYVQPKWSDAVPLYGYFKFTQRLDECNVDLASTRYELEMLIYHIATSAMIAGGIAKSIEKLF